MCLAIPARIAECSPAEPHAAVADILGVRRRISVELLDDGPVGVGDWVLVHVGFALARISESEAADQLSLLERLGEGAATDDPGGGPGAAGPPS